jgi:hypothetical protein
VDAGQPSLRQIRERYFNSCGEWFHKDRVKGEVLTLNARTSAVLMEPYHQPS